MGMVGIGRVLWFLACAALCLMSASAAAPTAGAPRFGDVAHLGLNRVAAGTETQVSTNWAGYAVTHRRPFTSVTGRWVQPAATCTADITYSGFWIGLGGFAEGSRAVEQTGTLANCNGGEAEYAAWYELYPMPPVYLRLAVRPGDRFSGTVGVQKTTVLIRLKNLTTGKSFAKKLRFARPDVSSAEWVAEAPSGCDFAGECFPLPLTNFGTVSFWRATASIKGHSGRIADPAWVATTIELRGDAASLSHAGANAIPGALGPDGGSFAVTWQQLGPPPAPAQPGG